jgi:hypothetical protein
VDRLLRLAGARPVRTAVNVLSLALVALVAFFTARHFAQEGWPLHDVDVPLVVAAGGLFFSAYLFKASGWRLLFADGQRPSSFTLAVAGGAAAVTGVALPGRFDEAVRIGVVRRYRGKQTGIGAICLSLLLLGLIDTAALSPLAGFAAGASGASGWFLAGLIVVAAAGAASGAFVLALPRIVCVGALVRFRIVRWAQEHCATRRDASTAWALISISWFLRGSAIFLLLEALSVATGASAFTIAFTFLCASAASSALPIAPAGAATQAGAGAAILIATGTGTSEAVAFAVAAQALAVLVGAAIVVSAVVWHVGQRLAPARAYAR